MRPGPAPEPVQGSDTVLVLAPEPPPSPRTGRAGAPVGRSVTVVALAFLVAGAGGGSAGDRVALTRGVTAEAIPLMAQSDYLGLGAEARQLGAWVRDHRPPLILRPRSLGVQDAEGERVVVSPTMALTLERLNQWYGLAATNDHPITHEQLKAATLAPASVERIRALFTRAIHRGVRVAGKWLTPETGGEATIDRELRLVEARDPRWSTIQDLVKVSGDPTAVAALFEDRAFEVGQVDTHGLLRVAVARLKLRTSGAGDEVRRALLTVAQNSAPTYSLGPEEQFALIAGADWQGRYVGGWHTHAPHDAGGEWAGGDEPSFEDMQNAVQYGQYLTLSFQPDGFDLYDAEPLADAGRIDLALLKVIRYRSPSWREHFRRMRPAGE